MLPASFGNHAPRYKTFVTLPPGPRRIVDSGERPRFHVAPAGRLAERKSPPLDLRQCRKILVVKLDFIGDWVLTTPFLDILRRNAPRAEITAVVLDRVFDLAAASPDIDRVVSVSRADQRRAVFAGATIVALSAFRRDYRGGVFDVAFVPRWDADFNGALQIAFGSRAHQVVGFAERSGSRRRTLNRGEDRFYTHTVADHRIVHEADRDLVLIEAVGGRIGQTHARIHLGASDRAAARDVLAKLKRRPGHFLAIAPFGSKARTTLPPARLARIVRRLSEAFDVDSIVVGGPADVERAADFARESGTRAVSAAGMLGTRQSAALLAEATALIGMDSGPAHLAAAVGTPVAVLSCHPIGADPGHAHAPERFAPRGRSGDVLVIRPERLTAPCVDGCDADDAHCILALDEDALCSKLTAFVKASIKKRSKREFNAQQLPEEPRS